MNKNLFIASIGFLLAPTLISCGTNVTPDYSTATIYEAALNSGIDTSGKIVKFQVTNSVSDGAFGYTLWAGQHLNFVNQKNPNAKRGDYVTLKVDEVNNIFGSWIITYSKIYSVVTPEKN